MVTVTTLSGESAAQLNRRFAQGSLPIWDALNGNCDGQFLAWNDELSWPAWLALRIARAVLFDWRGWAGKRFVLSWRDAHNARGWNRFPLQGADEDLCYPFAICRAQAFCDQKPALRLDYTRYPNIMRRIQDDLRQIDEKLWLGKMWLRWRGRYVFVGFFALSKA
jgi:hypothetical protein